MTALTALTRLSALPAAPPLDPSREQARAWARQELSDPAYARARPGLLQRAIEWVLERLQDLRVHSAALADVPTGVVLLVLVVAVVAIVVLLRARRLRGPGPRAGSGGVFDDVLMTAAGHRALADAAAGRGDWPAAVRERFRAVVRTLEERTLLDERPGRTAHEAADEAAGLLPVAAQPLRQGALLFDDICYGGRAGRPEHDRALRELDELVSRSRTMAAS